MAVAGEQRMAVALDQAGQHTTSIGVDGRHIVAAVRRDHFVRCPDCDDHPVADGHRAIGDDVQIALSGSAPDDAIVVDTGQRLGVNHVEIGHWK